MSTVIGRGADFPSGAVHRVDVAEDFLCGDVMAPLAQLLRGLRAQELARTDLQALDARRCDRFGAEQEPGQSLGIGQR
jgi:hypothetical protein